LVSRLITNLGAGDSEVTIMEQLNRMHCEVVISTREPKNPALNAKVAGWRHLVRKLSLSRF